MTILNAVFVAELFRRGCACCVPDAGISRTLSAEMGVRPAGNLFADLLATTPLHSRTRGEAFDQDDRGIRVDDGFWPPPFYGCLDESGIYI